MKMYGNHTVIVQSKCVPARTPVGASYLRLLPRPTNLGRLLVLALALGLLAAVGNSQAAPYTWTNTTGAAFNDPTAWSPTTGPPGLNDAASFTINGTFDVPLTNNYISNIGTLLFGAASSSGTMVLTLDFGTNTFAALSGNANNVSAFVFGQGGTSTFYISCGSLLCTNSTNNARMIVGRQNGPAIVILTNGFVAAGNLVIANAASANGSKVVISGPNSSWSNSTGCLVGNGSGSANNSLVVSNSGSMVNGGSIQVGNAGFFNSVLVDTGGRLFTKNTGTIGATAGSSNNTVTVQGGALWDCGSQKLFVGNTSGQNNSLIVGNNATVSNITFVTLSSAGNSLVLSGGVLAVSGGITNSSGTVSGFGTIVGNMIFSGTGMLSPGLGTSVGAMTFSNTVTLVSGSTTTLKLDSSQVGSNDQVNAVGGITEAGTLAVVTNGVAPLNIGDQYQLFVGSQSASFSTITLPPLDPSKLWDTSQLASAGILAVTFQPVVPGMIGPTDQVVAVGSSVSISATATGVPTPAVQWQFNGTNTTDGATGNGSTLTGSTSSTLTLANAQTADTGSYCLIASNSAGVATNCMALTVSNGDVPPSISAMSDQTVVQGNSGTFNAAVAGSPAPTVQWYENGLPISGATGVPLILTNVQFSQDEFAYSLIASNVAGTATNGAVLHVIITPAIQTQPQSLIVTDTQAAAFTVLSTNGVPTPVYQWYFNNSTLIPDATNATYTIASALPANAGSYSVQISNAAGSVTSSNATLIVNSTMAATLTPANGAVNVCYDTPLFMTFDQTASLSGAGKVNIYSVTNTTTPVDTIDTSLGLLQSRSIGGDGSFNTYPIIINGNTVQIYPHARVLSSNQQYYVTLDTGIFTDTNGALYAGITTTNGWTFTTKPTGPANPNNLVVAADESGDFATVQGAVDSVPLNNTTYTLINIRNGLYTELVDVTSKNNLTFRGQDRTGTVVGYPNNNNNNNSTATRMAFKVHANDIAIENMTVTNMTPHGGSQAEALNVYTGAKRFILNNAVVASFQDTILINDVASQAYFYKSLIKGDTDYLWGVGNLFVTNCEIQTVNPATSITQPRTTAGSNGFSFVNCLFTRSSTTVTNTTFARALTFCNGNVAIIGCQIDSNVVGWTAADLVSCPTIRWWEYGNTDLDSGAPVTYNGTILTNGDPRLTLASSAMLWLNGWVPQLAPNILTNPVSVTVTAGVTATFSVAATGVPDPFYQWVKDGTNLVGATSATLTVSNPQDGDAGGYSVIVSNGAGSATSDSATLTILDLPPVADFSGTPTNGPAPLAVTFTDSSTGAITNRFWDFGDGNTTNTVSTSVDHTYNGAGSNTVSLTAFGPGGTSTVTQTAYIVVINPAQLVVNPGSLDYGVVLVGQTNSLSLLVTNTGDLSLTGTVSVPAPFVVNSGAAYTVSPGASTNAVISFIPTTAGAFVANAIFTSTGGDSTNEVSGVTPGNIGVMPATIDFGILATGTTAQASFVVTNSGGTAINNGTVTVNSGPFAIVSGANFNLPGLGSTSVTIRFAPVSAGAFTNSVQFSTPSNGSSTKTVTGTGVIPPVAGFSASPTTGLAPLAVTFTDSSTGTITNRAWSFGDGATTNTASTSLSHTYNASGTNSVSLTVFGLGGSSTANQSNYIIVTAPDTTAPQLQIVSPTDYQVFTNAAITASGTASDASGLTGVTVNGVAASLAGSGWSQGVTLSLGTNTLTVIATDASANLNTATQVVHAVLNSGPVPTNAPPQITTGLTVTNALLQVASNAVVTANETNTLTVVATDPDGDPLAYQWVFGDGANTNTMMAVVDHVYTNDCGPYNAHVTVSDGQASTNSDLTVVVACQMQITKMQAKPNFARVNADACSLTATIDLPNGYIAAGKSVTVDIGGAQASFTLNAKGRGVSSQGTSRLKFNKKADDWTVTVTLNKGHWQIPWAADGLLNAAVPKPGTPVTLTGVVLIDDQAFAADKTLHYTAKAGKSGVAR